MSNQGTQLPHSECLDYDSEIETKIRQIQSMDDTEKERLDLLEQRLGSILKPHPPGDDSENYEKSEEVPLAEQLELIKDRHHYFINKLEEILERLELARSDEGEPQTSM